MRYLVIIALFLLPSCSTTTLDRTASVIESDEIISSGEARQTLMRTELSETEKEIITHAQNRYMHFREKWKDVIFQVDVDSETFNEFRADYNELVRLYRKLDDIVIRKWDTYTAEDKQVIIGYSRRAQNFSDAVDALIKVGERHSAIMNALSLAGTGLSVISKIIK